MNRKIRRLTLDIPEDLHAEIKMRSAQKYMSIKKWILQAIAIKIIHESTGRDHGNLQRETKNS
jgi:predicted HicB family RNase H-like nuclease